MPHFFKYNWVKAVHGKDMGPQKDQSVVFHTGLAEKWERHSRAMKPASSIRIQALKVMEIPYERPEGMKHEFATAQKVTKFTELKP